MHAHYTCSVADVCWGVDGRCMASAGCDQTTRIFAAVRALPGTTASEAAICLAGYYVYLETLRV